MLNKKILGLFSVMLIFCMLQLNVKAAEEGATKTVTQEDIVVTIATDKSEYKAGEQVNYTITIENNKEKWKINKATFEYTVTEGLIPVAENSMPNEIPAILSGESFELSGSLIGDSNIFIETKLSDNEIIRIGMYLLIILVVILIVVGLFFFFKKKGGKGKSLLLLFLTAILLFDILPVRAAEYEIVMIRPYVEFMYEGQKVTIRAVMELHVLQDTITISSEDTVVPKKITCHDPSIFKDIDGTYYIFGSFLTGGYSKDLLNWTSIDTSFQATFTDEVKEQIREWNADGSAGDWNSYLWAPDIIYNTSMNKYCMYLSANGDNWKSNIVLLTADKVDGPYEYAGTIVYGGFDVTTYAETDAAFVTGEADIPERYVTNGIANKKWGDKWPNCIDPCTFYDDDGKLWMSYGSWSGGIFMLELDENTGLREYSVSYETDLHSDAYFGKKIAGGAYVSGEASYIQKIGDYYYLFISYGNLEAAGGYNMRVFRSEKPDGDYVDALGNSAFSDQYVFNYNLSMGVRIMGGYKWRNFTYGQVAQGHNSAFVDDNGRAYVVFHTRTTNGTEGHYVKTHQLFLNKEGWLVTAPYQTSGEALKEDGYLVSEIVGDYEIITHELVIDYAGLEVKKPEFITLTEDGKIIGAYEGKWELEPGTPYITLTFNGEAYSGVTLAMNVENTSIETMVFTAMGTSNQITIWGSKSIE